MKTSLLNKVLAIGLLSLAFSTNKLSAQQNDPARTSTNTTYYNNAFGIRLGETSGITFKHINNVTNNAVEIIGGVTPYSVSLTGLYEKYVPSGVNGLKFYFGGGGHLAGEYRRYSYTTYNPETGRYYRTYAGGPAFGLDGMMGIEYKIPRAPFAFSFDLKPNFEVAPGAAVYGAVDPGLGIKVAF